MEIKILAYCVCVCVSGPPIVWGHEGVPPTTILQFFSTLPSTPMKTYAPPMGHPPLENEAPHLKNNPPQLKHEAPFS